MRRLIFLIVDRHPVHRAAAVTRWLAWNTRRIRLFFLPGDSPEPDPDELLNQDVKTNALGCRRPEDQWEMMDGVRGCLWGTQRRPGIVRACFNESHVRYAAA